MAFSDWRVFVRITRASSGGGGEADSLTALAVSYRFVDSRNEKRELTRTERNIGNPDAIARIAADQVLQMEKIDAAVPADPEAEIELDLSPYAPQEPTPTDPVDAVVTVFTARVKAWLGLAGRQKADPKLVLQADVDALVEGWKAMYEVPHDASPELAARYDEARKRFDEQYNILTRGLF